MVDIAKVQIEADSRSVRTASGDLNKLDKSGRTAEAGMRVLRSAMIALGGALSVREVVRYADSWQNLSNQLRVVQKEGESLSNTQKSLINVSNDTRSSFDATATLYARLSRASGSLGLNQQELIGITRTINQAFAVSGATAQEAGNAIIQLSQGLAAGALRGEEFNSVSEQAPILMDALGASLNMTKGELRSFAAEGGITAEIVISSLTDAADGIDASFNKMTATFGQNMTVAQNNLLEFIGSAESVSRVTGLAGSALVGASNNLDHIAEAAGLAAVIFAARLAPSIAASTLSMGAAATAAGVLRGALALIGGPMGALVITGAALWKMWERNEEALGTFTSEIERSRRSIAQAEASGASLEDQIKTVETALRRTGAELANTNFLFGENSKESRALTQEMAGQRSRLTTLNAEQDRHNELVSKGTEGMALFVGPIQQVTQATQSLNDAVQERIRELEGEREALGLTERELFIHNKTVLAGVQAKSTEAAAIRVSAGALYDERQQIEQNKESQKILTEAIEGTSEAIREMVAATNRQEIGTALAARELFVYDEVMKEVNRATLANTVLTGDQVTAIASAAQAYYDATEGAKFWEAAAKTGAANRSRAEKESAQATQRAYESTRDYLAGTFVDIAMNGEGAFEKIKQAAISTVARIISEWAAVQALGFFGITGSGGGGGSVGGSLLGAGSSSLGGSIASGMSGGGGISGAIVGNGTAGSGLVGAAGSAWGGITSAAAAIPGWGWALAGTGALAAVLDKDETPSSNAGMLVGPAPGADASRTFGVDPFASGFQPTGFARREDQGAAMEVISAFAAVDARITQAIRDAGGQVNMSAATLSGYSETGQGAGVFLGMASEKGSGVQSVPMEQQLSQYAKDVLRHAGGISDEQKNAIFGGIDGSHRMGLSRVPYDGYRAELHAGEEVLTRNDPRNRNNSNDQGLMMMQRELSMIAHQVKRTSDILLRVTRDGNALRTEAA